MGFSAENYKLQTAYQKLHLTTVEKNKILEKLEIAGVGLPANDKLAIFCNIYAANQSRFMQAYAARSTDVIAFLNSELTKLERLEQESLKEVQAEKHRTQQVVFEQEEHLRALKLQEADLKNYKKMLEKLEQDYQAWREKQEQERLEREKLVRIITQALNELFAELLQSTHTHEFYFDGQFLISIAHADVYREVESAVRDFFNLDLHKDDYEAIRKNKVEEMVGNQIDAHILSRPRAEHARLLGLKQHVVRNEAEKIIRSIDAEMIEKSSYKVASDAYKKLYANYGETVVRRSTKELNKEEDVISGEREVVSEEKAAVSERKETVSEEKETVSEEKETVSEEKETVSEEKETVSKEKEIASEKKEAVSEEKEVVSNVKAVASEERAVASREKEVIIEAKLEASKNEEYLSKEEHDAKISEEVSSTMQVAAHQTSIQAAVKTEETKIAAKSSEAQIMQAFSEAQLSEEAANSHARKQHSSNMNDILKKLQGTEDKPSLTIEPKKMTASTVLPPSSLIGTPPHSSRAVAKNDPVIEEGQPAASTSPVRKRRF